ncbi:hypothetical protein A1O3_08050 [Capronia epimyces CBS 606.96]|uniref:Uncharacterized protein n=1 Tax=Capronia epimyces CBS 606.96 TaxID=1182542 RepID=W9XGX4_9EURO|nr:uncharacterized protein A1O3_08050 [Capronia epimyces CBS 606.96]EXJ79767.1 hypothetical protein A1O3_08050 [Capronia epimyces CBS 606.96]
MARDTTDRLESPCSTVLEASCSPESLPSLSKYYHDLPHGFFSKTSCGMPSECPAKSPNSRREDQAQKRTYSANGQGFRGEWAEKQDNDRGPRRYKGKNHGSSEGNENLESELELGMDMTGDLDTDWNLDFDMDFDFDFDFGVLELPRLVKRAAIPQTMAFHLDWWIARLATEAMDLNLKTLLASMMLWREKNDIGRFPTCRTLPGPVPDSSQGAEYEDEAEDKDKNDDTLRFWPASSQQLQGPTTHEVWPVNVVRNDDGSFAVVAGWDVLLQQVQQTSRRMRKTRRWRMRGLKNAAGWCKWQRQEWIKSESEFVSDPEGGYHLRRTLEDDDGDGDEEGDENRIEKRMRVWTIDLGYRRK